MTTITHKFDQDTLDALIGNAIIRYQSNESIGKELGAVVSLYGDYPGLFLDAYDRAMKDGFTRHPSYPVEFRQNGPIGFYRCYLVKPVDQQQADVATITRQVTDAYNADRAEKHAQHLERIIQETLSREAREQEKKAAAALEKAREKARKDALEALGAFE